MRFFALLLPLLAAACDASSSSDPPAPPDPHAEPVVKPLGFDDACDFLATPVSPRAFVTGLATEQHASFTWVSGDAAGQKTGLSIRVTYDGGPSACSSEGERSFHGQTSHFDAQLAVDVTLHVKTDDGALDEAFVVHLVTLGAPPAGKGFAASFGALLPTDDIKGSFRTLVRGHEGTTTAASFDGTIDDTKTRGRFNFEAFASATWE